MFNAFEILSCERFFCNSVLCGYVFAAIAGNLFEDHNGDFKLFKSTSPFENKVILIIRGKIRELRLQYVSFCIF